jgi:hypothetical protein
MIQSAQEKPTKRAAVIACGLLDIAGVSLAARWDDRASKLAATYFMRDLPDREDRHHMRFDTY